MKHYPAIPAADDARAGAPLVLLESTEGTARDIAQAMRTT
jgi:hypothetical protein